MGEIGREYALEIKDVALPSGFGVARIGELVVFVEGAVTGDRVKARIVKRDKRCCYAEVRELVEASPHRVAAGCRSFGDCGGCDLQSLDYDKQLEIKQNHLHQVLKRIGGTDPRSLRISSIVPSTARFFYRSKVEFAFGRKGEETVVGLHERVSPLRPYTGRIVEVDDCCLFSPVVGPMLAAVRSWLKASGLQPYDPATGQGTLRKLVVRQAKSTDQLMINLISHSEVTSELQRLIDALYAAAPKLTSFYLTIGTRPMLIRGAPYLEERLSHLTLRVYPFSFFQPNPETAALLYSRIIPVAAIDGTGRAVGLYSGSGPIELFLSGSLKEVKGYDSMAENISCARENCSINEVKNCLFVQEKVERLRPARSAPPPDLLVIDPPRRGMSREAYDVIGRIGARKVVYISCNPSTLARDLKALASRYHLREVVPFDFFPQTAHFEVLTLFERK